LQGGPFAFGDFPHHPDLTARYAKDTGVDVTIPEAAILFQADSPAWSQSRYYQDAAIRAAFEKIIRCREHSEAPRVLLSLATGSGKTQLAVSVAVAARTHVERLQCYRGVTEDKAIGRFDEGLQRLYMEFSKRQHEDWQNVQTNLKGRDFFRPGPLMRALEGERPCVPLIDELDKVDDGFEPGARADGVVLFDRPNFKESTEKLFLQIAQADEVDRPVLIRLPFTPPISGDGK